MIESYVIIRWKQLSRIFIAYPIHRKPIEHDIYDSRSRGMCYNLMETVERLEIQSSLILDLLKKSN